MIRWMRFPGQNITTDDMRRAREWCEANGFDANRVPLDAYAAYDTDTDEFIVEHYTEPRRVNPLTNEVPRVCIRRRRKAWMNFNIKEASDG